MATPAEYPTRPRFFANRFVRVMAKACLANEIGAEACWLLTVIALTEDAKGYRSAVTFFNEQLMPLVGLKNVKALARVRDKAVAAGWLSYVAGRKGIAGRYWVVIPDRNRDWDDGPTDEQSECQESEIARSKSTTEAGGNAEIARQISTTEAGEKRDTSGQQSGTQVGNKAGHKWATKRDTSGQHSSLPLPDGVPGPVLSLLQPPTDGPDGEGEPSEEVHFDPLRAAQDDRKLFERRWNAAGLRAFSRLSHNLHPRLEHLLRDVWWAENYPVALERAGKNPFLREGAGRRKGAYDVSEFLFNDDEVRRIIDGFYDQHASAAPGAVPAAPVLTTHERMLLARQQQAKPKAKPEGGA